MAQSSTTGTRASGPGALPRRKKRRQRISAFDYTMALGSMCLVISCVLGTAFYLLS